MATEARKLILDNLDTVLKTISTGNGFKTDVETVDRTIKEWATTGSQEMPWLGVKAGRERHTHQPFGWIDVRLPIHIVGHVNAGTDAERSTLLNALIDDVVAAIQTDTRRGGNAIQTTIQEIETDEGDPDTQDSRGGSGSMVMLIEVLYQRRTTAT